jgi:hypothetical protein
MAGWGRIVWAPRPALPPTDDSVADRDLESLKPMQIIRVCSVAEQRRIAPTVPDHLHVWFVVEPKTPARVVVRGTSKIGRLRSS